MKLRVNGVQHDIPEMWRAETLLTVLREHLGLVGAKFGCGDGECGTCVVLLDGVSARSCVIRAEDVAGGEIETVEGLADADGGLHPVQQVWHDDHIAQCGFCQPGQILQAVALLRENPDPDDDEIAAQMSGNLCRCGTYDRIRRAVRRAAEIMQDRRSESE